MTEKSLILFRELLYQKKMRVRLTSQRHFVASGVFIYWMLPLSAAKIQWIVEKCGQRKIKNEQKTNEKRM